jgi:Antibiotic biosynthesis monooxygenase
MITIDRKSTIVTLINAFSCEPSSQSDLIRAWLQATETDLGNLPGIVSAALHRSLDGTRVVNYAQWQAAEDWERLLRVGTMNKHFQRLAQFGRPDAHLYEVVYTLDKTANPN